MKTSRVTSVKINDAFWSPIQDLVIDKVIPYQADIMEDKIPTAEKSHAIQNFRIAAGEADGEFYGMVFQDSDVAKWLEAAAYALSIRKDVALERRADEYIALIGRAQEPDGYLNTFFTVKEPQHKWQNLQECHELYCSGHMIEAAVAYYEATGKDALLNTMRRNADLICARFGEGKTRGVPGHQEIELALYRLYQVTGEDKYLQTAQYFLDERGREPDYFSDEVTKRDWSHWGMNAANREYAQNHAPVREQTKAVGHSVRAVYMYTAMAAVASQTEDAGLLAACRNLWDNIVNTQMYITGGVGSTYIGEAFTVDYDLPNDTVYAETCASIAMVFFARQMLEIKPIGEYADIMEKQLYNGILSGMQLDGTRFFYVNPLEVVPSVSGEVPGHKHVLPTRPEWYRCACCPPNVARLVTSLGHYAWGESGTTVFNHLYLGGSADLVCAGGVNIACETTYPWEGAVGYTITPKESTARFTLATRIPMWCDEWTLDVNDSPCNAEIKDGYAYISRSWRKGDKVLLTLSMKPQRIYSNTKVRENAGCVALMRGPLVYCIEGCDNGPDLSAIRLPRSSEIACEKISDKLIGDVVVLKAEGVRMTSSDALYSTAPPESEAVTLCAIPYYAWGNRGSGGMRVWLLEAQNS